MEISPLALNDIAIFQEALDSIGMHLSEFSFPNLYLFKKTHEYEKVVVGTSMFVSGLSYDKKRYLMPMHRPDRIGDECFSSLKVLLGNKKWDFIFPVPEEWLECFDETMFNIEWSPDDSDYLFFTEKMKNYPGKKMHKKKNLLNQFMRKFECELLPFDESLVPKGKEVLDIWQTSSVQELHTNDYRQCKEALELNRELQLTTAFLMLNGKAIGFIIGEELNPDTFTIHFAKADIQYKGVYQFLFSQFCKDFCSDYEYINLEQDLGQPGLRKTKTSYRPDLVAKKYRVSLAN